MKRRNWWFIGCTLALLVACLITWKWSEQPPFKFLENAELMFITTTAEAGGSQRLLRHQE